MADLFARQQLLWQLCQRHCTRQPMLRLSRTDDCYWICDLPRHTGNAPAAQAALLEAGFLVAEEQGSPLWKIDLSPEDALYRLPAGDIPLPKDEEKYLLYALWRLLKQHPAQVSAQPMPLLRSTMKLTMLSEAERAAAVQRLHSACAALLNRRQPLPHSACGLLAATILKEEEP